MRIPLSLLSAAVAVSAVAAEPDYSLTVYSSAQPGQINTEQLANYGDNLPGYALVRDTRSDLPPALEELEEVLAVLNKNEDNIDDSIRLMAPFYRVFANTLGNGPWFDTYIQNFPPIPEVLNGGGIS